MRIITAAEERAHAALVTRLESENARLWTQIDALSAQIMTLKASGAQAPLPKRESDGIAQVIADVAGSNRQLRTQLGRFAREQATVGADPDEIIQKLREWDADDDGASE